MKINFTYTSELEDYIRGKKYVNTGGIKASDIKSLWDIKQWLGENYTPNEEVCIGDMSIQCNTEDMVISKPDPANRSHISFIRSVDDLYLSHDKEIEYINNKKNKTIERIGVYKALEAEYLESLQGDEC